MNINQIEQELSTIFGCSVHVNGSDKDFSIHMTQHGQGAEINFKTLSRASKILETENIDMRSYAGDTGCDTCGYGATTEVEVSVNYENEDNILNRAINARNEAINARVARAQDQEFIPAPNTLTKAEQKKKAREAMKNRKPNAGSFANSNMENQQERSIYE